MARHGGAHWQIQTHKDDRQGQFRQGETGETPAHWQGGGHQDN